MKKTALCLILSLLAIGHTFSQVPTIIEKNGRHALLVDGKPFLVLGGACKSCRTSPKASLILGRFASAIKLPPRKISNLYIITLTQILLYKQFCLVKFHNKNK